MKDLEFVKYISANMPYSSESIPTEEIPISKDNSLSIKSGLMLPTIEKPYIQTGVI